MNLVKLRRLLLLQRQPSLHLHVVVLLLLIVVLLLLLLLLLLHHELHMPTVVPRIRAAVMPIALLVLHGGLLVDVCLAVVLLVHVILIMLVRSLVHGILLLLLLLLTVVGLLLRGELLLVLLRCPHR